MVSFNPMHYLSQAWNGTHSVWGKACIVLFYSFLWLHILGAAWQLCDPTSGWDCVLDTVSSQTDLDFIIGTTRIVNLWMLGFFLYADRGGIKLWNVFMVWVVFEVQNLIYKPVMTDFISDSCPDFLKAELASDIVLDIWIFLALACSFMEMRANPSVGDEESQALVDV